MNARANHPNAPEAHAVADVQTIAAVASRTSGHTALYVSLADGRLVYVCDLPLRVSLAAERPLTIMPTADAASLHWNIGAALTLYSRRLHEDVQPTDEAFEDERVLGEVAESQRRAHVQLFGGTAALEAVAR